MKRNSKLSTCLIILSTLSMLMPFTLSAQEPETSEQAAAEPEEEDVEVFGDEELHQTAKEWPKGNYVVVHGGKAKNALHLGPTGLWGYPAGQNIWVKRVDSGSPADGKIFPNDIIYGVKGKVFPTERDGLYYLGMAISEAETKEVGGKLILDINRGTNLIQVTIDLKVMGSFSSTTPWNCEKSENIITRAEEYMQKGLRPETGMPDDDRYMYGPWHDNVLFLMATGNPELQGLVRRYIRQTMDEVQAGMDGNFKIFNPRLVYNGWGTAYLSMLFGEYYHRTGDPAILPYYDALISGIKKDKDKGQSEMDFSWPPTQPTAYGTHPAAQMPATMGLVLANEAGINLNTKKLDFDLKYLYHKRAEYGYVKYCGYGAKPIESRQHDEPLEISEDDKRSGMYSSMNGKLGTASALYSMVDGHEKTVQACAIRCAYAFNRTSRGHGGAWFNGFWTPIGAYHAGPKKFQHFMKEQQWWRELYRDHTGSMWQRHNARKIKESTLATGFAIHRTLPRKMLRMFGAPRSMFGPDAPAYVKKALAAHRNRDYTLAEQLTLKLIAEGKVPAKDKARVSHFLNSIQTLNQSVEYDLTFTEKLLSQGNFALASVELPQLKMVVSPDNPRLQAIATALESPKAKAHIASSIKQAGIDKNKAREEAKEDKSLKWASKDEFERDLENIVTFIKDGSKYGGPKFGKRGRTTYATFSNKEITPWRLQQMDTLDEKPEGWELPGFDDSQWNKVKKTPIRKGWARNSAGLLRTQFEVKDPMAFKSLHVRCVANEHRNVTLYLNGEVVAKVLPVRGTVAFDLRPESVNLLRKGTNTFAVSSHRNQKGYQFSLRLEGVRKGP